MASGKRSQAIDDGERALAVHRETGHWLGEARAYRVLGDAVADSGDAERAQRRWRKALDLFHDIGAPEADEVRAQLAQ